MGGGAVPLGAQPASIDATPSTSAILELTSNDFQS